jgi:hypothetical protein
MPVASRAAVRHSVAIETSSRAMPPTDFLLAVLQHTPVWVWPLLAALLSLGVWQAFPRTVKLRRATLLPAAMLALSLWGVISVFGSGQALVAWALGGVAAATWNWHAGSPRSARWSATEQVFRLPGSWVPLLLILGIFCTKFGVGMSLAHHPDLRHATGFAAAVSMAYGVFSGLFAGRAMTLWHLTRRGLPVHAA